MRLVVMGLGYVGLPLALAASESGIDVIGFDTNQEVVDRLSSGHSHVDDIADSDVGKMLGSGFRTTSCTSSIRDGDCYVICVPTPLHPDGGPDLTMVKAAARVVGANIRKGALVVLESTTYPGTTEEIVLPILEEASGLRGVEDFHLAFSPERVDPGNAQFGVRNTPKVVGGISPSSSTVAAEFYAQFVDQVVVATGTREAEMAKLLENTYRHVNIALVNEMLRFSHELDIDLWEVIRLASTKPFGFEPFYPGPGVGGHCIPIDPNYLSHDVRRRLGYSFRFVELAQEINSGMPNYVLGRAQDVLNRAGRPIWGSRVLLLGVTYKPNVGDTRESPAHPLAAALLRRGADLAYHDPFVPTWRVDERVLHSSDELYEAVRSANLVILLQSHRAYDVDELVRESALFLDTRGRASDPRAERL